MFLDHNRIKLENTNTVVFRNIINIWKSYISLTDN